MRICWVIFFSATNVLQQGKLFREAAALYREHVKNDRMAAECLEKGGLLDEAIAIYLELDQSEKVGDLYRKLGREEKAEMYYRKTIEELRLAKAYQKAATVLVDKLAAREEAKAILLDGWKGAGHPEACLTDYLELSRDAEEQHLAREITYLYSTHVPRLKRIAFLNVLTDINRRYPEPGLQEAALGIAFEVVSQQVELNDTSALKLIGNFLPEDRLLTSDATRFIQRGLQLPPVYTKPDYVSLRNDTSWYNMATFHDQLLGMGMRNGEIHFLRANWEGKITYQFLFKMIAHTLPLCLLADPGLSDHIFIVAENMKTRIDQKLLAYSYFEREITLKTLDWLPQGRLLGCCINGHQGVSVLHYDIHGLMLSHFTMDGKQLRNQQLQLNDDSINPGETRFDPYCMVWRKGHFYCGIGEILVRIDTEGAVEVLDLGAVFTKIAITDVLTALKIVVLTTEGCLWITPSLKEMKLTSGFFGGEIEGKEIKLMTDNRLIIAGGKRAAVYELKNHAPVLQGMIETEEEIKGIIAIPKRHYCAFLEGHNRVSVYKIQTE
ncbi:tetratricopeptide repeat protein [Mucilaginibacter gracilis]|uniref:tetratricopeptide repeat protein n=1 Tax=Mucilaginibacter gracilis TaxID=423350 RepID=UPI000EB24FFB|nr:hypothetical protein [Mucilaginibacter gracilis]